MIIPMLAIAGNLAQKKYVPPSVGNFPVTTTLFTFLLISVILILGALTFFPALSLANSRTPLATRRKGFLRNYMASHNKLIWDVKLIRTALWSSVLKLNPRNMMANPVMFVVEIGSVITTVLLILRPHEALRFNLQITLWLWFTVLFANFAEAMAEGRGKAQAETLRKARSETMANRLTSSGKIEQVASAKLRAGDYLPGVRGRTHSWRWRDRGRRCFRRRIGHHR